MCWTLLHLCLHYKFGLWKTPGGGITTFDFVVSKLFGDKGLQPCPTLTVSTVSGRELMTASVLVMSVCRDFSSNLWPCVCNNDASWKNLALPYTPMWLGGFLFRLIQSAMLFWRNTWIFVWSISLNALINSCSAPIKFGPFSECICLTFLLLGISFLRA